MAEVKIEDAVLAEIEEFGRHENQGGGGANAQQISSLPKIIGSSPNLIMPFI